VANDDIVVLVPGFLGFSRTGGYYYFADRFSAALRAGLETSLRRSVPVIPTCTLPMDHLAARQAELLRELHGIVQRMGGQVKRIHLVGHSAGGVDAQLLTCDRPLDAERWNADDARLLDKIASVVGLAAPHHGTCLADAPIADLLVDPVRHARLMPSLARPLWHLSRLIANADDAPAIGSYMLHSLPDSAEFLWEITASRGLIRDLAPRAMQAVRANIKSSRGVPLRSFVTVVPESASAEPFFKDLRALTADTQISPATALQLRAAEVLQRAASKAIQSGGMVLNFDEHSNDGVVNSVRELCNPDDPKELAGIVIGDHADVLGHYDRADSLVSGRALGQGLFHSGSRFGDNQFFELNREISRTLVELIRTRE
jgi:pimeloyl-ACP methyl ester carboxylesterase